MKITADVDGNNITSLLTAFFAQHLPEIILEERLFKSIPPLYLVKTISGGKALYKNKEYLFDKHEYYDIFNHVVADNVQIALVADDGKMEKELKKSETIDWLEINVQYLYYLRNLSKKSACIAYVAETICWDLLQTGLKPDRFKKRIEKDFPEMKFDLIDRSLTGSFEGQYVSAIVDDIFLKNAKKLMKIMTMNPTFYVACRNANDKKDDYDLYSIGQFLNMMDSKYSIDLEQRFKGVGEVEPDLLFRSTLNPKARKLYRFTMNDIKAAMATINILHGRTSSDQRKNLINDSNFTLEDIDN